MVRRLNQSHSLSGRSWPVISRRWIASSKRKEQPSSQPFRVATDKKRLFSLSLSLSFFRSPSVSKELLASLQPMMNRLSTEWRARRIAEKKRKAHLKLYRSRIWLIRWCPLYTMLLMLQLQSAAKVTRVAWTCNGNPEKSLNCLLLNFKGGLQSQWNPCLS